MAAGQRCTKKQTTVKNWSSAMTKATTPKNFQGNLLQLFSTPFQLSARTTLYFTLLSRSSVVIENELYFGKRYRTHFLSGLKEIWFEVSQQHRQGVFKISKYMVAHTSSCLLDFCLRKVFKILKRMGAHTSRLIDFCLRKQSFEVN